MNVARCVTQLHAVVAEGSNTIRQWQWQGQQQRNGDANDDTKPLPHRLIVVFSSSFKKQTM